METRDDPTAEAMERLAPVLGALFDAYGIGEERRQAIVEEARRLLIVKWPRLQRPDSWLLRWIVERCRTPREETALEEASD